MATDFDRIERIRRLAEELGMECETFREYPPESNLHAFLKDTAHECGLLTLWIDRTSSLQRPATLHAPVTPQSAPVLSDTFTVPPVTVPPVAVPPVWPFSLRETVGMLALHALVTSQGCTTHTGNVSVAELIADKFVARFRPEGSK